MPGSSLRGLRGIGPNKLFETRISRKRVEVFIMARLKAVRASQGYRSLQVFEGRIGIPQERMCCTQGVADVLLAGPKSFRLAQELDSLLESAGIQGGHP
jgi:hypothetical protein